MKAIQQINATVLRNVTSCATLPYSSAGEIATHFGPMTDALRIFAMKSVPKEKIREQQMEAPWEWVCRNCQM